MNEQEYRTLIYSGSEDRNREFKQSFLWSRNVNGATMAKVTKSILAMSNLRDGGHIIIGVNEISTGYKPEGVLPDHLQSLSYDSIADFVRNYAEPYARFSLNIVSLSSLSFVVIAVAGFDEVPVICKKSYDNVLSESAIYYRSRSGRPRSEPISNYADTRELLDLAVEKGVIRFLNLRSRVLSTPDDDQELFNKQIEDLL